jgi:hypothetical protein
VKKALVLCFFMLVVSATFVVAQDATPEATPAVVAPTPEGGFTLENLTADPKSYYGQQVSLEGVVEDMLNVRAFILGEGAPVDNDQVLVINTSGKEFDIRLTKGARFRIIGTVYASFNDGGYAQLIGASGAPPATPEAAETQEAGSTTPLGMSTDIALMFIPANYRTFTIVAVPAIEDFQLITPAT